MDYLTAPEAVKMKGKRYGPPPSLNCLFSISVTQEEMRGGWGFYIVIRRKRFLKENVHEHKSLTGYLLSPSLFVLRDDVR